MNRTFDPLYLSPLKFCKKRNWIRNRSSKTSETLTRLNLHIWELIQILFTGYKWTVYFWRRIAWKTASEQKDIYPEHYRKGLIFLTNFLLWIHGEGSNEVDLSFFLLERPLYLLRIRTEWFKYLYHPSWSYLFDKVNDDIILLVLLEWFNLPVYFLCIYLLVHLTHYELVLYNWSLLKYYQEFRRIFLNSLRFSFNLNKKKKFGFSHHRGWSPLRFSYRKLSPGVYLCVYSGYEYFELVKFLTLLSVTEDGGKKNSLLFYDVVFLFFVLLFLF